MFSAKPKFIPFLEITNFEKVLVVDSFHRRGVILSHWRGSPNISGIHDDTSTGIVLNAIKAQLDILDTPYVTNNHFDIDGFLGVWSLQNPALALQHEDLLRQMALIGDFREWEPQQAEADLALKLVSWMNSVEVHKFYQPFASQDEHLNEAIECIPKYEYFLSAFTDVLRNPELIGREHLAEYRIVKQHTAILSQPASQIELVEDIRLLIVETPEPLHYYSLFGQSRAADMVLSIYSDQRYELEYKYTTWIDTATRKAFPRIRFDALAYQLNELEESHKKWTFESMMDTGPALRLSSPSYKLTKAMRFDHPYKRHLFSSAIPSTVMKDKVIRFYRKAYRHINPQYKWTWKEMHKQNQLISEIF